MKSNNPLLSPLAIFNKPVNPISKSQPADQYRTIIENSNQAFILLDPDGTILESNKAANRMFGYSARDFIQLKRWDIVDHADQRLLECIKSSKNKDLHVIEGTGIKSDGSRFPVEISKVAFTAGSGENKCSLMIADISDRKRAETTLLLNKDRFDHVLKATKTMVWDWDLVTGEVYRNNSELMGIFGQPSDENVNTLNFWLNNIHPEDKSAVVEKIEYFKNSKSETDFSLVYRFKNPDGSYIFICDKGSLIRDKKGKVIRMIGAAENITEQRKTAIAVEESEHRYRMFLQQSTEGIFRIDMKDPVHISTPADEIIRYCDENAVLAECNDAFAKTYGLEKAADLIGVPLNQFLPISKPSNYEYLLKFITQGYKVQDEITYEEDIHGNEIIISNNVIGIIENDYLMHVWGTQKDITEQKRAEKALAESENRLRAIVQTDPECIKLLNKEGLVLEMNPAGLGLVEADSAEQVLGKNVINLVMPKYHDAFKKMLADVFNDKPVNLVFEICGFKGRTLYMESHNVPLKNESGEIVALLSVTRDITESRNAQIQLMASEGRYRNLFNKNPASILIWEIDSLNIVEANDTAVNQYGYTKEEFLDLKITDLGAEKDQDKLISLLSNKLKKEISADPSIWNQLKKDGSQVIMEIMPHKIIYKGKPAIFALASNITDRVFLENSLAEERKLKHQLITEAVITGQENERTELGQELHDNINQILASTKLYIECAIKENPPRYDLVVESKSLVEKAMIEIRKLSKSLLPPSLGEIGLFQALQELVSNITELNRMRITVDWQDVEETDLSSKLKLTIFRIVQEQLANIVKHAEATDVLVSVTNDDTFIKVTVKDNGLGFDTQMKRNGVGLRNISSRAEVHRGAVSLISSPGSGCELSVKFPQSLNEEKPTVYF